MLIKKTIELILEETYEKFHYRKFVEPDPIQFLYNYPQIEDREIVGLIACSLAMGRVKSIIIIIDSVLRQLPEPYKNIMEKEEKDLYELFKDFKYRFYKPNDLVELLISIKVILTEYGTINACFLKGFKPSDETILPALIHLTSKLNKNNKLKMIADPSKNSPCKRLQLYLRWMIRHDEIDPGGWQGIPTSKLIIPLDTHIYKISKLIKLTSRNNASMKTALEITKNLKKYDKEDPIKYDFSLTRPGIHPDLDYTAFELK